MAHGSRDVGIPQFHLELQHGISLHVQQLATALIARPGLLALASNSYDLGLVAVVHCLEPFSMTGQSLLVAPVSLVRCMHYGRPLSLRRRCKKRNPPFPRRLPVDHSSETPPSARRCLRPYLWTRVLSVGAIAILFTMLYKWLPNVAIAWKAYGWARSLRLFCSAPGDSQSASTWSERHRLSLWRRGYAGRAPIMCSVTLRKFFARRRIHLPICNTPRAFSKSFVLWVWYAYRKMRRLQMRRGEGNVRRSRAAST